MTLRPSVPDDRLFLFSLVFGLSAAEFDRLFLHILDIFLTEMHSVNDGEVSVVQAALHFIPYLFRLPKIKLGGCGCGPALFQAGLSVLGQGAEQHIVGNVVMLCLFPQVFAEFRKLVHACFCGQLRSLFQHTV